MQLTESEAQAAFNVDTKKVMVIDDCYDTLAIMKKYLESKPELKSSYFSDEYMALREYLDIMPDVVVVDLNLEEINGIVLTNLFNKLSLFAPKVILISKSRNLDKKIARCEIENVTYLEKPFSKEKLITEIEKKLGLVNYREVQ